jgi:DNA-directed RNA polymerase sigma subunit (sigma70/sigma32)
MAQFIRDYCDVEQRTKAELRRTYDRYIHCKHRLASANIRLAAHVAKRFRHHALGYADLLQEAVCGLMQAIDRFVENLVVIHGVPVLQKTLPVVALGSGIW